MTQLLLLVKVTFAFGALLAHEREAPESAAVACAAALCRVSASAASRADSLDFAVVALNGSFLNRARDFHTICSERGEAPNDPKLSDSGPGARL